MIHDPITDTDRSFIWGHAFAYADHYDCLTTDEVTAYAVWFEATYVDMEDAGWEDLPSHNWTLIEQALEAYRRGEIKVA